MVENLSKLLERDGKIEIIASKAEQLSTTSSTYRRNANKARIKMRNRKIFLIVVGVLITAVS
jgi:Synaptobrevin